VLVYPVSKLVVSHSLLPVPMTYTLLLKYGLPVATGNYTIPLVLWRSSFNRENLIKNSLK
jgi:hypothetical protein